ncbi:hypothetical protein GCM10009817_31520 [Terrabacter lapilli]|uniref:DoxX-like protein n=1 Tax=Terrabacter lapilli TaxID=436231 RepID=A0ABP5DWT1_9MICO
MVTIGHRSIVSTQQSTRTKRGDPAYQAYAVGVVEVVAGLVVALHPRLGALVVAVWLGGIIVNLLLIPGYYDVALRDFGLLLAAVALQRLATRFDPRPTFWPLRRAASRKGLPR